MTITFRAKHKSGFTVDLLEPFTFPAGEAHTKGFENLKLADYDYFIADVRGHNPQDLFELAMWSKGLDQLSLEQDDLPYNHNKYVFMPYLPGARADRGVPFGAEVYADFLTELVVASHIIAVDPHSPVMPELLGNYYFHEFPFERIIKDKIAHADGDRLNVSHDYVGVIAPDKGAHDRAQRAASVLHVPVFTAGKTRDFETGVLTGFHMEDELPAEGKFLIVDDICDGGGTFIGLAEAIKKTNPDVKLDLWVTHGIFSKGVSDLLDSFGIIHTTNSYTGTNGADYLTGRHLDAGTRVKVYDIVSYLYGEVATLFGTV